MPIRWEGTLKETLGEGSNPSNPIEGKFTRTREETVNVHLVEDEAGELVDVIPFCSDYCHRGYCAREGVEYNGWNGCHETEQDEVCAYCDEVIEGFA